MALYTKKLIMSTFQEMLEELPFDKITVATLVKRAGISPNTFYYHYQDIYALLDAWFRERAESFIPSNAPIEWKSTTKAVLHQCKAHPKTVYHVFDGLSRDHLERYIFSLTDDVFLKVVQQVVEGRPISDDRLRNIASFCRYLPACLLGFLPTCILFPIIRMNNNDYTVGYEAIAGKGRRLSKRLKEALN